MGSTTSRANASILPTPFRWSCRWLLLVCLVGGFARRCPGQASTAGGRLVESARIALIEKPLEKFLDNGISSIRFSPDGSKLAVSMRDPDLALLLDASTLKVEKRFVGHLKMVTRVRFGPDAKKLYTSGRDGTIRFWDVASAREEHLIDSFQGEIPALEIGADGRRLVSGERGDLREGSVQFWSPADGKPLGRLTAYDHSIVDVALAPDNSTLATASYDETLRVWSLKTLTEEARYEVKGFRPHRLIFSPDSKLLFVAFNDRTLRVFDAATLGPKLVINADFQTFLVLALSADGTRVATADAHRVQVWNSANGSLLGTLDDAGSRVNALDFSPDGRSLAVAGLVGNVRIYRVEPPAAP